MSHQYYTLEHLGHFQKIIVDGEDDLMLVACPIAMSLPDADRLIKWLDFLSLRSKPVGASIDELVVEARLAGCEVISVVTGWDSAGNPIWWMKPLPIEEPSTIRNLHAQLEETPFPELDNEPGQLHVVKVGPRGLLLECHDD